MRSRPSLPNRIEGLCFAALASAIAYSVASGTYVSLATPRSKPYLIIAVIALSILAAAAWLGLFHATERSAFRWLVALIIPALLITIPFQQAGGSTGFDIYAGGRAIAIPRNVYAADGARHLHGLDDTRRTITVRNDEFGSWFEHIDHNPQSYVGYRIRITGFVSKPSTLGTDEFQISRQFMSCCILDMTPFGFTAVTAKAAKLHEYDWVTIDATIEQGTYGTSGHERQGLILQVSSLQQAANAPTGYFYWQ